MKKIITALANPTLNNQLKNTTKFEIVYPDIQYQEGINEVLEENKGINFLLLSGILPGNMNFYELINSIRNNNPEIEIIIFLEKEDYQKEKFLISKGITNIFFNNRVTKNEIINLINKDENVINHETSELKKIILENNNKKKNNLINIIKNIINNKINIMNKKIIKKNKNKCKIISVIGSGGIGKSIFSVFLANSFINKKILILDFDIFNNSISTILGINKFNKKFYLKKSNIIIQKINSKIDLICLKDFSNETEIINLDSIIKETNEKYDFIIIDTFQCNTNLNMEEIVNRSDDVICLTEANLLEIKKVKVLLKKLVNEWNISIKKINIVFNKYNENSIDGKILKKIFRDFNILGKINLNKKYNLIINNNYLINNKKINEEYKILIKKIINSKNNKNKYKGEIYGSRIRKK